MLSVFSLVSVVTVLFVILECFVVIGFSVFQMENILLTDQGKAASVSNCNTGRKFKRATEQLKNATYKMYTKSFYTKNIPCCILICKV